MIASAAFYDPRADHYAARYASARFEDVHAGILDHLPTTGSLIADIGAGSGRDAFALAERGYDVTAVEPSAGMRHWAVSSQPHSDVRWVDDALPSLGSVRLDSRRFQFVLCSAVLMHLPATSLAKCFRALAAITTSGGKIAISVRAPTPSDPKPIFHAHTPAALKDAAASAGLELIDEGRNVDVLDRAVIDWCWMVFRRP